ncbi:MAG: cupin domain-containing protein [Alphaproteobacteria bacterium]|nr:cupin domain-containing protein [Alphaproteobacteria bacterium]
MTKADQKTINKGAVKGGNGNFIFRLMDMEGIKTGERYSSAVGPVVEGQRTQVGLMRKEKGTGARPHSHPNEQWNYVVQGRMRVTVDGEESIVGPGTLLYFPPNIVHSTVALPEEDAYFFVVKDMTHGIQGNPVDEDADGAYIETT